MYLHLPNVKSLLKNSLKSTAFDRYLVNAIKAYYTVLVAAFIFHLLGVWNVGSERYQASLILDLLGGVLLTLAPILLIVLFSRGIFLSVKLYCLGKKNRIVRATGVLLILVLISFLTMIFPFFMVLFFASLSYSNIVLPGFLANLNPVGFSTLSHLVGMMGFIFGVVGLSIVEPRLAEGKE